MEHVQESAGDSLWKADASPISDSVVCVIGLGYVGLPVAQAFSRSLKAIGFDVNAEKIRQLEKEQSAVGSQSLKPPPPTSRLSTNLTFTDNPEDIGKADFVIISVPTPVTKSKEPDLSHVENAAKVVGRHMKKGTIVSLESTIYQSPILNPKSSATNHQSPITNYCCSSPSTTLISSTFR